MALNALQVVRGSKSVEIVWSNLVTEIGAKIRDEGLVEIQRLKGIRMGSS